MKESIFQSINPEIIKRIEKAENILVIAHKNPDGDALSSTLAIAYLIEKLGKKAYPVNGGPFQRAELSDLAALVHSDIPDELIALSPLVIVADCSTPDRPGELFEKIKHLERIVIDHHSFGESFTDPELSFIVPESPSTTLLVDILREALGIELDKRLASYLYTGLATDTGFFHFISNAVGFEVFTRTASFVKAGVDPYDMYDRLTDGKELSDILKSASVIKESNQYFDGRLIIAKQPISLSESRISDDIYQQLLKARNIKAVVFLKEKEDRIEIGFRAKKNSGLDVGEIAKSLGGGGHKLASGASVKMGLKDAEEKIVSLFHSII